jgi:hypothetical protein
MPELLESVTMPPIEEELKVECPFELPKPEDKEEENENPEKDDTPAASAVQQNNGGILGENLTNACEGKPSTINDFYRCDTLTKDPVRDTRTNPALTLSIDGVTYSFIQAAHHLIPGVASLANSSLYKTYMKKGAKIETTKKQTYEIEVHIGYNVNGGHNGIWLPGNYAIRADAMPLKKNWSEVEDEDFKLKYMAAAMKKSGGRQFHDAHAPYNREVRDVLNKISQALVLHQDNCKLCKDKNGNKIHPPYKIKRRLYSISAWLKGRLTGGPAAWGHYFTSGPLQEAMGTKKARLLTLYQDAAS